ncbi:MAG: site-specific integrase [candidate division Zixibacteria bacterium]|nr:site-specific integrase [candidate division Zixibacteria bacterium]
MALFKKGRTWYVDYYVDGKRKREAVGPNRKMAEKILMKRKTQIAENKYLDVVKKPKTTFDELAKIYMDYAKTNKLSWTRDQLSIKTLATSFGGKRLGEITPLAIEGYKSKRLKKVSPATLNRELACLKHMFTKAIQWDMTRTNPVKAVRMLKENNARIRYLTKEEIVRLFNELDDSLKPVVAFALYTGLRKGEILKLTWNDIDFHQQLIFVKNSKNGEKREIPLPEPVFRNLKVLPKRSTHVFDFGEYSRIECIRRGFTSALKRAGITDFTFHDLRHTFASHLVMSGVDLLTVKELLGHKSINMTLRYAHLSPDHKRKAVASLKYFDGHYMDTMVIGQGAG